MTILQLPSDTLAARPFRETRNLHKESLITDLMPEGMYQELHPQSLAAQLAIRVEGRAHAELTRAHGKLKRALRAFLGLWLPKLPAMVYKLFLGLLRVFLQSVC